MNEFLAVMKSYGPVDNFQPVFVTKLMKYPRKKDGLNFDDIWRFFRPKDWYGAKPQTLIAKFGYVLGFTLRRYWAKESAR